MSDQERATVRIYFVPQTFPCGPDSSCCGPVGQTEEELQSLASDVAAALPAAQLEVIDAGGKLQMGRDLSVMKLLNTFGAAACPIISINGEVVSMGPPNMSELTELLKTKLRSGDGAAATGAA